MSNETKTKHLPGSWEGGLENHVLFTHGLNIPPSTVMRIITEEEYQWGKKCVNAMEGIEDPEKEIKELRVLAKGFDASQEIIKKLFLYKTACEGINPDNPMVVAEGLKSFYQRAEINAKKLEHLQNVVIEQEKYNEDVVTLLKALTSKERDFAKFTWAISKAEELLTKIQSK